MKESGAGTEQPLAERKLVPSSSPLDEKWESIECCPLLPTQQLESNTSDKFKTKNNRFFP